MNTMDAELIRYAQLLSSYKINSLPVGDYSFNVISGNSSADDVDVVNTFNGIGMQCTTPTQSVQGIQGIQGPRGIQGFTGTDGIPGLQGYAGTVGIQGIQGLIGLQGITGNCSCTLNCIGVNHDYAVSADDYYIGVNSSRSVTITLPANPVCSKYIIKAEMGPPLGNRKITIVAADGATIDGEEEYVVETAYASVQLFGRDGEWFTV